MVAEPTTLRQRLEEAKNAIFANKPTPTTEERVEILASAKIHTIVWRFDSSVVAKVTAYNWTAAEHQPCTISIGDCSREIKRFLMALLTELEEQTFGEYQLREKDKVYQ